jgi:hypothetical protein
MASRPRKDGNRYPCGKLVSDAPVPSRAHRKLFCTPGLKRINPGFGGAQAPVFISGFPSASRYLIAPSSVGKWTARLAAAHRRFPERQAGQHASAAAPQIDQVVVVQ